jgi:hypothetical protein
MIPHKSVFTHLSALLAPEKCYLAVHTGIEFQNGSLFCIERATGKTLWESPLWAGNCGTSYSGAPGFHCVGLLESQGRIFAFGIAGGAAYVEAFNTIDGKNIFRFATDR